MGEAGKAGERESGRAMEMETAVGEGDLPGKGRSVWGMRPAGGRLGAWGEGLFLIHRD